VKRAIAFFEDRGAMARLILKIYEHDETKRRESTILHTRALLDLLGSNHSGQSTIRKAYKQGYIKRTRIKRVKGDPDNPVGQPPVVHLQKRVKHSPKVCL
jgi:hypothetical protein